MVELPWQWPILAAPMAGGPSTPKLVAAVGESGGLGSLAAGYLTPGALAELIDTTVALTTRPYAVNFFLPTAPAPDASAVTAYADRLTPLAQQHGTTLGEPRWTDDDIDAKVDVVCAYRPAMVSFSFGKPCAATVERIRMATGALIAVTVTSPVEAAAAAGAGADLLIVQGAEAGGHRAMHVDDPSHPTGGPMLPLAVLLPQISAATDLPLVAAGGIMDGAAIRAVQSLGAVAAQLGTAFLCTDEAGTSAAHRAALLDREYSTTVVTRAFSGRPARGLRNRFADDFTEVAPSGYPEIHYLTKPLRAAAAAAGSTAVPNLWAGTNWRAITKGPAAELIARLRDEMC